MITYDESRVRSPAVGHGATIVPSYRAKRVHRVFRNKKVNFYEGLYLGTAYPIVLFKKEKKISHR